MTLKRMDNVLIVVDDLEVVKAGLTLEPGHPRDAAHTSLNWTNFTRHACSASTPMMPSVLRDDRHRLVYIHSWNRSNSMNATRLR